MIMGAPYSPTNGMTKQAPLAAVAILPNRSLAQEFLGALSEGQAFRIASEWTSYPPVFKLEAQLRQARPEVVLIEVSADLAQSARLIEAISALGMSIPVVALHTTNEPAALLECLRAGAAEFLCAPFTPESQRQAAARVRSLLPAEPRDHIKRGRLVAFASAKPGSGASTPAAHTAFALHAATGQRILLVDFALWSGTIRLLFKLPGVPSLTEALEAVDANRPYANPQTWAALVQRKGGVDLLPSPSVPSAGNADPSKLRKILDCARPVYDWVIVDLPTVFERLSLLMLPESEHGFLVTTPELPSLHLTRKAVSLLAQVGLSSDHFKVIVNRAGRADEVNLDAMAKIFKAPIHAAFPNDYLSLHKALSAGQPLGPCMLERALGEFAKALCSEPRRAEPQAVKPEFERAM
jgi:pilus assembly protein CpaE